MTWPPTWTGSNFKQPRARKIARVLKRTKLKTAEDKEKKAVRFRDKVCRFPFCGCRKFGLALHVAHQKHKGMGGNPKGDRSDPALMVQVCSARHRENIMSIDRGTIRWRALTKDGANGPIAWDVDLQVLTGDIECRRWLEVAREAAVGYPVSYERHTTELLRGLAQMEK